MGLSAQPSCYWNVSTLAGSGTAAYIDGVGAMAGFNNLMHVAADLVTGIVFIADSGNNRLRAAFPNGTVYTVAPSTTFIGPQGVAAWGGNVYIAETGAHKIRRGATIVAGGGASGTASGQVDGTGTNALFALPNSLSAGPSGIVFVTDYTNSKIRAVSAVGIVTTVVGGGPSGVQAGYLDAVGTSALLRNPAGITGTSTILVIGDSYNHRVRIVTLSNNSVLTIAGNGVPGSSDGYGASASFNIPVGVAISALGVVYVSDAGNKKIRCINTFGFVSTIAGSVTGFLNAWGPQATFGGPYGLSIDASGALYVGDQGNNALRKLACVPCPASYYCFSGAPVLCPDGSYCPLNSINATLCPIGSFSPSGSSSCTPCFAGTFTSSTGSTSCQRCPGGHYCPAGTSSWARLNCGRGNYCPDGSGAPTPCPYQVPPSGGWGALQVQGPAFLVETAHCLNHCFWNFTSGDGMLSKC
jgi:hypothetical protein